MKICQIYRTKQNYILVTKSFTDIGLKIADDPIYVMDLSSSILDLKTNIFNCLRSSKDDLITPKDEHWKIWQQDLLFKMQQKTFTNLYKNSSSCNILLSNNLLTIQLLELCNPKKPTNGLCSKIDNDIHLEYSESKEEEITIKILKTLENPASPSIR
jgi:hypothetical protein